MNSKTQEFRATKQNTILCNGAMQCLTCPHKGPPLPVLELKIVELRNPVSDSPESGEGTGYFRSESSYRGRFWLLSHYDMLSDVLPRILLTATTALHSMIQGILREIPLYLESAYLLVQPDNETGAILLFLYGHCRRCRRHPHPENSPICESG